MFTVTTVLTVSIVEFVNETAHVAEEFHNTSNLSSSPIRRESRVAFVQPRAEESGVTQSSGHHRYLSPVPKRAHRTKALGGETISSTESLMSRSDQWANTNNLDLPTNTGSGSVSSIDDSYGSSWTNKSMHPGGLLNSEQMRSATWTLDDPHEIRLFQFWIERVATWFDVISPYNVFQTIVPEMAIQNTILRNAILLTSAQHIRRFDPQFPARPFIYHEKLLRSLIPYIAEKGMIEDEGTLVAAMLLRCFEEHHGMCLSNPTGMAKVILTI